MVGNQETPGGEPIGNAGAGGPSSLGESNPPTAPPSEPQKRRVTSFKCPSCGGTVEIRTFGLALSVVCANCRSVIDATDEDFRLLARYTTKTKSYQPQIPLGTRGTFNGKPWELIGFVVRKDLGSSATWEEYLLWNPYYGYRWLTCYQGHWNFVTTIKDKPEAAYGKANLKDRTYKMFYNGQAEMLFVLGEFYWKVAVGAGVMMTDYIDPPQMLSMEKDGREVIWSVSEYMTPKTVQDAFKLKKGFPSPKGVGANQPSNATSTWKRMGLLWLIFTAVLTIAQVNHVMSAKNQIVLNQAYEFVVNGKSPDSITTPVFEVPRLKGDLAMAFSTPTDNSWLWLGGELVNDDTGDTYPFERTLSYYHGYDGGEAWSEGSNNARVHMSQIPGGKYYLNIDTESGDWKANQSASPFTVLVVRDTPTFANYFWCLFLLAILPAISFVAMRRVEVARWSDSDYSPYVPKDG